jgi:AcrR family transcriptional regulator
VVKRREDSLDLLRRELILKAAASVFADTGYRLTRAEDILVEARIPRDTLYPYFVGTGDCFLAVLDRGVAETEAQVSSAISGREGWGRQTYAALRVLLGPLVTGSPSARIVLVEAPNAGPAASARYEELGERAVEWLRRGRKECRAATNLPDDFERMVVDGVTFLLGQTLRESKDPSNPELVDEVSQYVLEPFVGPSEFRWLQSEFRR